MTRWTLLVLLAVGCHRGKIGDHDRARLEVSLAEADIRVTQLVAARTAALRAALGRAAAPGPPCRFALPPANALVRGGDGRALAPPLVGRAALLHFTLLPSWALLGGQPPPERGERESLWARMGLTGTNHGQYGLSRDFIAATLTRGTYDPGDDADKLVARLAELPSQFFDWELVVVTDKFSDPHELAGGRFEPGEIVGRAFLWSYAEGRMRCAGPVVAHNQDEVMSIKIDPGLLGGRNGFLEQDLEAQAFAAAVSKLQASDDAP